MGTKKLRPKPSQNTAEKNKSPIMVIPMKIGPNPEGTFWPIFAIYMPEVPEKVPQIPCCLYLLKFDQ
jgi:hypothetical protein